MLQLDTATEPKRLAAPAPTEAEADQPPAQSSHDRYLDEKCERWVSWCRTRRLYGPAPLTGTILGKMTGGGMRPLRPQGPDAISSAELSAFHIAYTCQPREALDRQVFEAYYVHRVKPVKSAAAALGISRKHFYAVLIEFRRRVQAASLAILADNEAARDALPHGRG